MSWSLVARLETQRTLAFGAIGGSYTQIGTQFYYPMRQVFITNLTDVPLQFSDDGKNDKFPLGPGQSYVSDIMANGIGDNAFIQEAKKVFYVKTMTGAPTILGVYVGGWVGTQD